MHDEREILVKRVFPHLRKLCEERRVTWTEVDLRWGITDEQAEQGTIVPLCLAEIDRCRPFFIGLLGEYYGTPVKAVAPEFRPAEGLPADAAERSVTEIEIIHGALGDRAGAPQAYFYFRDPGFVDRLPAGRPRSDYLSRTPDEVRRLGQLKDRIRQASLGKACTLREGYRSPEVVGRAIRRDFTRLIDRFFPKDGVPGELDREAAIHDALGRSRRFGFVGRESLLDDLDSHAARERATLVLTGEAGAGKSALLACWAARMKERHPDDFIFVHYTGCTPQSADWQSLVRRLLSELKRSFDLDDEVPSDPEKLRVALTDWVAKVAGPRRAVLVLDGLDQLHEDAAGRQLSWLPDVYPANVRVMASSLEGESLQALRQRGWPELPVPALASGDVRPAALAYFGAFGKTPSAALLARLEASEAARNPLFLRSALDELRQLGQHDSVDARAAHYLSAAGLPELFDRILDRWEADFSGGAAGLDLVRRSLCLIACARFGLTEHELRHLLGAGGRALPHRLWSPFYLAAESVLSTGLGVLGFNHDLIRKMVERRWMPDERGRAEFRRELAGYFAAQPDAQPRKLDELPSLLILLERWDELVGLLTTKDAFHQMNLEDRWRWELHACWRRLHPHRDCAAAYAAAAEEWRGRESAPDEAVETRFMLAIFLVAQSETAAASSVLQSIVDDLERGLGPDHPSLCGPLTQLGLVRFMQRRHGEADALTERALAIAEANDRSNLGMAAGTRALLLKRTKRYAEAEALYRRQMALAQEKTHEHGLALVPSLSNLAQLLQETGRLAEAEPMMHKVLDLVTLHHGAAHPHTATAMHNLGALLCDLKQYELSEELLRKALAVLERYLPPHHPRVTYTARRLSSVLAFTHRIEEAMELRERALSNNIALQGPSHREVGRDLNALALLYVRKGESGIAEALWRRAIGIYAADPDPGDRDMIWCFQNFASFLLSTGRVVEAQQRLDWLTALQQTGHSP
jgi:nephrocystin-3